MCYSQYPSEGLDLLNKIKNIEVYMGNDNTKALSGMDMTTGSIPVKILKFSIPLMLAQILEVLFNMSDVAVVGKFSSYEALGAVGSTSLLVTLFTGFLRYGLWCECKSCTAAWCRSERKCTKDYSYIISSLS